jgi:hypothetical protein
MGQLTFQATLGGSVNLIGPNTVATTNFTLPSADGSSGQALTTNGSGTLAFANIPLASAVSGTLPIANGGTGTTSTTFANLTTNVTGTLPIANGGTNSTATPTAGGIVYGTGTAQAVTAAGTSGYFLQSNGASAPSWVAPSSSAMVLVASATASSSSEIVFTNLSSSYRAYMLEYDSVYPSAGSENLLMTVSTDNGSTYLTSGYVRALVQVLSSSNTVSGNSNAGDAIFYIGSLNGFSNTSTNTGSGIVYIFAPNTAIRCNLTQHTVTRNASTVNEFVSGSMLNTTTTAVNAFKLRFGSGTVAGGNFRLYALVNA